MRDSAEREALLACPFCGNRATFHDTDGLARVICDACGAEGEQWESDGRAGLAKANAISAWNRRASTPPAPPAPKVVPLSEERIDHIAELVIKGMPDGIRGFCKVWGWQQFARALLEVCDGATAPVPPVLSADSWRVALVWSSSDPKRQIHYLATSPDDIEWTEKHKSFIQWVSPPHVMHLSDAQIRRLYDNSPERHSDVTSFAAFTRVVRLVEAALSAAPSGHKDDNGSAAD
jgi:Lar family restriction alleviation protein